jgi:N,N-dimethylformamidase beta subunit-like, C-terminal
MTLPLTRLQQNPRFVCRGDPDQPVHARQWFEIPGRTDGVPEVWCYTDCLSYAVGETVRLHAISTVPEIEIEIHSEIRNPVRVLNLQTTASWTETIEAASVEGCNWPEVAAFKIRSDWPSGMYIVTVRPLGDSTNRSQACHPIVVRPSGTHRANRLLLITADGTWNAYNDWGGSNHYEGIIDPSTNLFSAHLSTQRPFARGFVTLPPDAPRALPATPSPLGARIVYPHMEWAWREGYSKKYVSAGWASYERVFSHWAEAEGYLLDIATQQDLHARPEVLEGYRCIMMVGHDEYWSWQMRDAVDDFVARGGRVARFAGNFMWQIRLEDDGRTQVCHKYRAREDDPLFRGKDKHMTTNSWEAPEVGRPGHQTFGLDATRGLYAGWGGMAPHGPGGFTLYRPEHWAFEGCGLGYGDILGAAGRVFGYEVDGLAYRIEDGLPYPEPCVTIPDDLQILAMGLARMREDSFGEPESALFVADHDAVHVAEMLYGSVSEATLTRVDRGSGMMIHFHKGRGEVFHAGATEWVAGLLRHDKAVEQMTRNVLNRFLA